MSIDDRAAEGDSHASTTNPAGIDRRQLLSILTAVVGGSVIGLSATDAGAQSDPLPIPRRAVTGRDESGKSVFKSFDVTPDVVAFESYPGLAFYDLYSTDASPHLTGHEPDPMLTKQVSFPRPGGSLFRLVLFPGTPPQASKPVPDAYEKYLAELSQKVPGMAEHFEHTTPGMHTSDTLDYDVVIRGELILELDGGKTVHLRQGDCVVQNGTRHRWYNPLPEPCLMASILIGGNRAV